MTPTGDELHDRVTNGLRHRRVFKVALVFSDYGLRVASESLPVSVIITRSLRYS